MFSPFFVGAEMRYIVVPKHYIMPDSKDDDKDESLKSKALPSDWEFMKESGEVLENIPDTWKQYPLNTSGKAAIIDMEYKEMVAATAKEAKMHELVHLASACLNLWRELNAK